MSDVNEDKESKWRLRAYKAWALVGICVLIGVVLYICQILWQAVAVIIVTALTVFLLHGFVQRLENHKIPRWAGTLIAFLIIIAAVVGCILALIPTVTSQLSLFVNQLPAYSSTIQDIVSGFAARNSFIDSGTINSALQDFVSFVRDQAGTVISTLANGLIGSLVSVGNVVLVIFVSLICSFWILLDLPTITRELRSLIDDKYQDDIDVLAFAFGNAVYGWAKSTLICAFLTGVVSWIVFMNMGIPYSAVLGFICGILYFVPYIGPMISCAVVAIIALFVSPATFVLSIIVNVVINNVVANVISPKLMKSSVNVYPALILIAILVGSALGGIAGMLLSIPVIGALQGVFVTYYEAHTGRSISTEDGALFQKQKSKKLPRLDFDTGKIHLDQ